MRWSRRPRAPRTLSRGFVTPEGVDLRLELASAGARAGAFALDVLFLVLTLIILTIAAFLLWRDNSKAGGDVLAVLWLLGFFLLRNGYFILLEMGGRGATFGKRLMGLRVVARDGARLTGGAVVARNAMREIEVFLPLSFLGYQAADGTADAFLVLFELGWSFLFLFFPLFNRDRLRIGDLIAGTWVVQTARTALAYDLASPGDRPPRVFSDAALDLYGIYELQTLEDVLRHARGDSLAAVARTIRDKAGLADDGDDYGFLSDYYAALCARLEGRLLVGRKRADKFSAS